MNDASDQIDAALGEARAREAALREILQVISRSRADEQPVFDMILEQACRLCDAPFAALMLGTSDNTHIELATHKGGAPEQVEMFRTDLPPMDPEKSYAARSILEKRVIHIENLAESEIYRRGGHHVVNSVEQGGMKTSLYVPLLFDTGATGCICAFRRDVRKFTPDQIDLISTFAAQAVIAIENVRQFREVQTRLEREAATREILEVISRSRDDEQPVFQAILENAARQCRTSVANLALLNEDATVLKFTATHGRSFGSFVPGETEWPTEGNQAIAVAVRTGKFVHVPDLADTDLYRSGDPTRRNLVDDEGIRSVLAVPLTGAQRPIGVMALHRDEPGAFSESEISLIRAFAAQAVIAIDNVRQFREVQTRLEREKATSDVLSVISRSRDDDQPVFDVILENAARLCDAPMARLHLVNEEVTEATIAGSWGEGMRQFSLGETLPLGPESFIGRTVLDKQPHHAPDLAQTPEYEAGEPLVRRMVDGEGVRSRLIVPLIRGDRAIGCLSLNKREVAPFDASQIALVETFAAQAVIAIENVRQFRELQTRLEREQATGEILKVISRSRDDATPVFEILLKTARHLCHASNGAIVLGEEGGGAQVLAAQTGASEETLDRYRNDRFLMDPDQSLAARAIVEGRTLHFDDVEKGAPYREGMAAARMLVEEEGIRSCIFVPLISNGKGIGCLNLLHQEQRTYSADEIALVETFAAQAVIAIENVRQFRELQARLEREKATGEVLSIISQSRDDEQPVFDAILESSARLCNSPTASLFLLDKERDALIYRSQWGEPFTAYEVGVSTFPISLDIKPVQAVRDGRTYHVADIAEADTYLNSDPVAVKSVDDEGIRTLLSVPLMLGRNGIGCINLVRREVKPFDDRQIELVRTFASQAVIAIENVRQFRELQSRLRREAANREILQVISRSREDENPVFDTILENATRLCDAPLAFLSVVDADRALFRVPAHVGAGPEMAAIWDGLELPLDGSGVVTTRAIAEKAVIQIPDLADETAFDAPDERRDELARLERVRTYLVIPMVRDEEVIGTINLYRREVRPFDPEQITLLETFAAQAVIAIENVRQFRAIQDANSELETRLEREAATSDVLSVISRSRDDELPVFQAIHESASRLCDAPFSGLFLVDESGENLDLVSRLGGNPDYIEASHVKWPLDKRAAVTNAVVNREVVHIHDVKNTDAYRDGDEASLKAVEMEGTRTFLAVPMLTSEGAIGTIALYRREVRPFTDEQISIVRTFAAQAVIAIENVRQFKALEARTEEVQALNTSLEERVADQVGEIERMGKLKSFLPAAVADTVVSQGADKMLKSHRALLGVLFCDIRGFTAFCETAEPEETIEVLQTYHEEMGKLIVAHGAGVDHRMGDGIMVLFNDPVPCDHPAGAALGLALAMRDRMVKLCKEWKRLGHRLGFGVGISLGYATVGMIGYEGRYDYTASGSAVNLAARLGDHASDGEILLSPRAYTAVEDECHCEPAGQLDLKGLSAPVEVMKAIAMRGDANAAE